MEGDGFMLPIIRHFSCALGLTMLSGVALAAMSTPASASTLITHCDRYGADCYSERCDNQGDNCVRRYDRDNWRSSYEREDWRIRRSHYRHWYCDDDGCRYTYDIILQHRYDDQE